MLRKISVCIFASVAVLLFSSDASARWRSRTRCCGSGYGYSGTSSAAVGPGMGTGTSSAAVAAPARMSAVWRRGLRPVRIRPGRLQSRPCSPAWTLAGRATTRAALAGQRRGWACGPAWALAAPAGDADRSQALCLPRGPGGSLLTAPSRRLSGWRLGLLQPLPLCPWKRFATVARVSEPDRKCDQVSQS